MRITNQIRSEWPLFAILVLAFVLRVVGVGYGLPLTVVNDEYPFTYAALQMIQAHTLIPALHPELFKTILPYPPYLSYVLIPPFVVILGIKYLLWHGSTALFQATLLSDLSAFFITARLVNVLLGVFSVYLVYRISETWFRSRVAAAAAAFLLATSLLHTALSMVGRNWMPTSVIFLLILYVLTRETWSFKRRYTIGLVIAGIGMGITSLSALSLALIGLYYLCFDGRTFGDAVRDAYKLVPAVLSFIVLAAIPSILWHSGNAFLGDVTLAQHKNIIDLLLAPWSALSQMIFSEPIIVSFFLGGLTLLFAQRRRIGIIISGWFLVYVATFYFLYRFDPRFMAPLVPFFAIVGSYCIARLWNSRSAIVLCALLCIPLIASIRLSYLAVRSDTRVAAREWAMTNFHASDNVLIYVQGLRLLASTSSVAELRSIDAGAIRRTDEAESTLPARTAPHALNFYDVHNDAFFSELPAYAHERRYKYLMVSQDASTGSTTSRALTSLTTLSKEIMRFSGSSLDTSITNSSFKAPLSALFSAPSLGPDIVVYRLHE